MSDLPAKLGLIGSSGDDRAMWRVVVALLLVYAICFAFFYPSIPINDDESEYIRQTRLLLRGSSTIVQIDPFTDRSIEVRPGSYAMGTSFLAAPFVAIAGWRAHWIPICGSLIAAVLFTALLLREERRPPIFALILLGFPAALVMGRVVMSDVPSTAWVALGLWLFWRGIGRGPGWWLSAGFVAGASLTFRATNPLVFAPLFAGTVLRREWKCWALIAGGLVGLLMRPLTNWIYFGDPFFERAAYLFAPDTLLERLPLYLFGLLILVPGGLFFCFAYKGRRRPELLVTFAAFFLFFLFQKYSMIETGLPKRLILGLRYFLPLLPLMAFAMAESVPRLWQRYVPRGTAAERIASAGVLTWIVGVGVATVAVNPVFSAWSATQAEIRDEIDRVVPDDAVLVTNWYGTKKFVRELDRRYAVVKLIEHSDEEVRNLLDRHDVVYVVLLDRTDSDFWRGKSLRHAEFLKAIGLDRAPDNDLSPTATDRLRIWRVAPQPVGG